MRQDAFVHALCLLLMCSPVQNISQNESSRKQRSHVLLHTSEAYAAVAFAMAHPKISLLHWRYTDTEFAVHYAIRAVNGQQIMALADAADSGSGMADLHVALYVKQE